MTVGELRRRMSAEEYLDWGRYLRWRNREERWQAQRAAAQRRRSSGVGGGPRSTGGGR